MASRVPCFSTPYVISDEAYMVSTISAYSTPGFLRSLLDHIISQNDILVNTNSTRTPRIAAFAVDDPAALSIGSLQCSLTFVLSCSYMTMRHAIPHLGLHYPALHHTPILVNSVRYPCSAPVLPPTPFAPLDILLRPSLELLA